MNPAPATPLAQPVDGGRTLIIACGAIAHEVMGVLRQPGLDHVDVTCLPPELHNRPEKIPSAVAGKLEEARRDYAQVFVAYADCGTGGLLDSVLDEHGVERIPGAHCYEFFAGAKDFAELSDEEPGTFYLTDFLARNFQRLIVDGLGMSKYPELKDMYFGHYQRVVYLRQSMERDEEIAAREAAAWLGLKFEMRHTGYGELEASLRNLEINQMATERA